ncbi:polyprenol monophosphomannose synthase [Bacteriovorax sp. PP10]|uniref:Polyprenol monophosphomannose synthase n=1 Tax=Bacteriovorax antarcticus TaxID=3088717 RepID=A0ABU5VS82_9BACT|nr:polyprenol monophosphomannose synthase [Bacteriovorax sp. PP10]MEA9355214.1 polyprenol monophosphomannose synthase [Bacteriovorax sp. PP10]
MFDQSVVIIPTYNEALNVHSMIERLFHLYPDISILIIDDNSPDHTAKVVEGLQDKNPNLFLLKREGKLGLGTAYLAGFNWALMRDFEYIAQMDCDFSHDPSDIKNLLNALIKSDLAIGSRYSENKIRTKDWPVHRLALSYIASFMFRTFTGMKIKDMSGGFKAFRRTTLEKINMENVVSKGYVFQFEMNYKVHSLGLKVVEVPIIFYQRMLGVSKMNSGIMVEAVKVFIYLRFKKMMGTLN